MSSQAASDLPVPRVLWKHPNPKSTALERFRVKINQKYGQDLQTYKEIHKWTVDNIEDFWRESWDLAELIYDGSFEKPVDSRSRLDSIPKWFDGTYVNFAENMLYFRGKDYYPTRSRYSTAGGKEDHKTAVIEAREGGIEIRKFTWRELRRDIARVSAAMRKHGVRKGDRIALVAANCYLTLVVVLATSAVGAIFSTSSTDMGVKGILDRLLQIQPKFLFYDDQALYNGKMTDLRKNITAIVNRMKGVGDFKGCVILPRYATQPEKTLDFGSVPLTQSLDTFLNGIKEDEELVFEKVAFEDPLFIAYSSGTTGQPKCITHCSGGITLCPRMEYKLHYDMDENSVKLQYTTTGWIMFMASLNGLNFGSTIILYDGSPLIPDPLVLLRLTEKFSVTHLGISPRYMTELRNRGVVPRKQFDLSSLVCVSSTGMVLSDQLYEWFYDVGFPPTVQLANISGGTDLASTFSCANPFEPIHVGQLQGSRLGMRVEVVDPSATRYSKRILPDGEAGELVCASHFPTMPCMFWGEGGRQKYYDAYFAKFDNVWTHGDFIVIHPKTGGHVYHGRSDGVLNPSGIRFGSSDIYQVVEHFFKDDIFDSVCVGQRRPQDEDERVLLFVKMQPGKNFSKELASSIQEKIGKELSKRHIPKYVFETPEIPTTVNGKKVELPVKFIVSGKTVVPSGTLANPDSLKFYYRFAKLEDVVEPKARL